MGCLCVWDQGLKCASFQTQGEALCCGGDIWRVNLFRAPWEEI